MKGKGDVHINSLLTVLHAAHHTWLVESPWEERGAIMVIAPPGQLKTTMINSLDIYPDALCMSDINVKSLKSIRDQVLGSRYRTLAFGELEKLYSRNPATAINIEATLKQFIEEGLRHFSWEDTSSTIMPARAMVVAGLTPSMFGKYQTMWRESGYLRRFLKFQYILEKEDVILDAVHAWRKIQVKKPIDILNKKETIRYNLTPDESKFLMKIMEDSPESTPTVLLKKIACVLKFNQPKSWRHIIYEVAPAFGKNGAFLRL